MEVLTVRNLNFTYPLGKAPAIRDISFGVESGSFTVLCGATGSGKSTLLRMLKRELTPIGEQTGEVLFEGTPLSELDERTAASAIGYVMQRPEQQLVTDKVWHELAFGLENLGLPQAVIRRRVCEMAAYFGIERWFEMGVDELSGGQKQLLNLAAVMVMQPRLLLLDEPTAQLDPIAAADFLATVRRLNRETGITVLLIEHRLEEAVGLCDRLMVLEKGSLLRYGAPGEVCAALTDHAELLEAMPAAVRLFNALHSEGECPLNVREGRTWLQKNVSAAVPLPPGAAAPETPAALEMHDVWFRYERNGRDVLQGMELSVREGELFCLLGGNGSGKTTALSALAGLNKPYAGEIRVLGKRIKDYRGQSLYRGCLAMLPQDVQTVFLCSTVREELAEAGATASTLPYDLTPLMEQHPYDLSGGEQQLVALAKVLASKPRILLLDEPTKGIDAHARAALLRLLRQLTREGMTILMVTHDVEFAAEGADRCAMVFRGEVISLDTPRAFFAGNSFYTTAVNRMLRGLSDEAVTLPDAITACGGEVRP